MMMPMLFAVYALAADPAKYAKPDLLVEPKALATEPNKFHILDVRSAEKYAAGHVPGAVLAPLTDWSKAVVEEKADAAFWKKALAAVGVTPHLPVVLVSDDLREECRAWFLLKTAGVADARILNGGHDAYAADGFKYVTQANVASASPHDWKPDPDRIVGLAEMKLKVKDAKVEIVDGRSTKEFNGEANSAKRNGRVPGAAHLEWSDMLDAKTKKFKPAEELDRLIKASKIDLGAECVSYCQGGGRASVVAFGLELMGGKNVRNYYRSWAEWGNRADTPVEK